jgi:hypothetical protein
MNCLNSFEGGTSKVFGDGSEFAEEQNDNPCFFLIGRKRASCVIRG